MTKIAEICSIAVKQKTSLTERLVSHLGNQYCELPPGSIVRGSSQKFPASTYYRQQYFPQSIHQ